MVRKTEILFFVAIIIKTFFVNLFVTECCMVNLVFVTNTCSEPYFEKLKGLKYRDKLSPSQKYFDMLIHGFLNIDDCRVTCLTARSIDPSNCKIGALKKYSEEVDGIEYIYTSVKNKKYIKNINNIIQGKRHTNKIIKHNNQKNIRTVFVYDPLAYDICFGSLLAAKKYKKCALVTDLPNQMAAINKNTNHTNIQKRFRLFFMNSLFDKFDCFCFLVEKMNIINKKQRPYVIIEGMVDNRYDLSPTFVDNSVVLYAGGLYEKFGIRMLVEAAKMVKIDGFELHLYGEGNEIEYIQDVEKEFPNIKYLGALSLDSILETEKSAKLLINPRPSSEEFTQYSFPSKTLEYMSTARPVLTTKLGGIPKEYFDFLYFIDEETVDGIKSSIISTLMLSKAELDQKGRLAQNFVLCNKSNEVQARKLWDLLK